MDLENNIGILVDDLEQKKCISLEKNYEKFDLIVENIIKKLNEYMRLKLRWGVGFYFIEEQLLTNNKKFLKRVEKLSSDPSMVADTIAEAIQNLEPVFKLCDDFVKKIVFDVTKIDLGDYQGAFPDDSKGEHTNNKIYNHAKNLAEECMDDNRIIDWLIFKYNTETYAKFQKTLFRIHKRYANKRNFWNKSNWTFDVYDALDNFMELNYNTFDL
ncbi:HESP035 [Hemileuca sp. nucleopolyhedrovirus]|uniref:HESP035 n=1 Tax=Hemileuca sp. nucleopolyhedrovirus TaxID=1367203 RepID=S5N967_9ABAC|nr:HESP035 [Hemileuca sp. nucleopolyhedrovirus]AGR56787.1 HESP035 [Hemileuca sp. nucleopolyhedrovirus]